MKYILAIDQSTAGTKALLFDETGEFVGRADRPHEQKISKEGYVSHDPEEILRNTIAVVQDVVEKTGIDKKELAVVGISNQRETALVWERESKKPVCDAVVWQCSRGEAICNALSEYADMVKERTGLNLSPYFSAAKIAWVLKNATYDPKTPLCAGTIDSYLLHCLTGEFKTDYSNASRTQLFNIHTLSWDEEICKIFDIDPAMLPEVCDSDALFGYTDFNGYLEQKIPVHGVLGDSHGALFGQGCTQKGMVKATYGTGSSVMMQIGDTPILTKEGLVTSLAYKRKGEPAKYVLEGNINYSGAVMKWVTEDLKLIPSEKEASATAKAADPEDTTYLVPAFSGLGAPYFVSGVKAAMVGMSRKTGYREIVKAAEESIVYQISDILFLMNEVSGVPVTELRVDGGATRDEYLMQFQSDILNIPLAVSQREELSGLGAGYLAAMSFGILPENALETISRKTYLPKMDAALREKKYAGWKAAVNQVIG